MGEKRGGNAEKPCKKGCDLCQMNIYDFLYLRGFGNLNEGYCTQVAGQVEDLVNFTQSPVVNVMEIGFNAGHSADLFLQKNPHIQLTSFDLGIHSYVVHAKEYIDLTHPQRHTLILGDSRTTVPLYKQEHPDTKFDCIFVDGGHDYEVANQDLENCRSLANENTLVLMDDVMFREDWARDWTIGPTQAWKEWLEQKRIVELGRKEYEQGRGMVWGKYVM